MTAGVTTSEFPSGGVPPLNPPFDALVAAVRGAFAASTASPVRTLFRTDASRSLFEAYLSGFDDPRVRAHHDCRTCSDFFRRFGALVTIDEGGRTTPVFWDCQEVPAYYEVSVEKVEKAVRRARVVGPYLTDQVTWGTPEAGVRPEGEPWTHLAVTPPGTVLTRASAVKSFSQLEAEKVEHFRSLSRALAELKAPAAATALGLLRSGSLYRSEAVVGAATFFHDLHARLTGLANGRLRENLIWRAVADAPAGHCTPRSGMLGFLIEEVQAGTSGEALVGKWRAHMDGLNHMRPKAAPSAGGIAAAERLVEQLGIGAALDRRHATLDDVRPHALWVPRVEDEAKTSGYFDHLKKEAARPARELSAAATPIGWLRFAREVLPDARRIEIFVEDYASFGSLATAAHDDAPPILQWDDPDRRNPVSWWHFATPTSASTWGLRANFFAEVSMIVLQPWMWNDPDARSNHGKAAWFLVDGCRESSIGEMCLFPSIVRSELHEVRSTIEAHSKAKRMLGRDLPHRAAGVAVAQTTSDKTNVVRVTGPLGVARYRIDRWE